ncbi:uncharacterized protein [Spinacia oleracea]|uniref:Retrotransposon Copia-like N-terminal domain-containing protein n=1 Tax=Spinacia oleracea TaxID=3562 RepID=A0ABM3R4W3_SPIOL|nr:uncharacterized protein LOC130465846 [Spinacia oleracea]
MAKDDEDTQTSSKDKLAKEYYLGSSDAPGNVITPIKLRGSKNYDEWAKSIRRALISKRKFGFIDGTITEPTSNPDRLADWIAVHSMLVSWITHTIEEGLRSTVGDYDDAAELWLHLKKRFCVISGTRICQLKTKLGDCKQGKGESITDYYGRLSTLWTEIVQYARTPKCSCGSCKCNIVGHVATIQQEDYLHHFLIGLDTPYEAIRAQLLAQTPLPGVDEAYQTVINTERMREENTSGRENVVAFKVDVRGKNRYEDNSNKLCNHCNRVGHDEEGCYQLIGFPEWWPIDRRGGTGAGRAGSRGGRGGWSGRGRGVSGASSSSGAVEKPPVRANMVAGGTKAQRGTDNGLTEGLAGVTSAQVQQILDLLTSKAKTNLQGPVDEEDDWPR